MVKQDKSPIWLDGSELEAMTLSPATMAQIATASAPAKERWVPAKHHLLLNEKLLAIIRGDISRLLVTMPPQHGKSELISRYFPAWYLGMFPERRVILASYEAGFAATWGRKARDLLEEYGPAAFGVAVSPRSSAANRWDIAGQEGGMITAGAGGPITGRGAHIAIIDDPHKGAEDALSALQRAKIDDWYKSVLRTRLRPSGAIVLVQTRWHSDDLAGRRIKAMQDGGEKWDVLNLPALALDDDPLGRKPGEALWPEMYSKKNLEETRQTQGSAWFEAMYQQRPLTEQGAMFKRDWFGVVSPDEVPAGRDIRYWDLAATEARQGTDPDWTAGVRLRLAGGKYYVMHIARFRETPAKVEDSISKVAERDGVGVQIGMEKEGGASGKIVVDNFRRNVLKGYRFRAYDVRSKGSKEWAATPVSATAERGEVILVNDGTWDIEAFLDEAEQFPLGSHDDQIDALSGAFASIKGGSSMIIEGTFE